MREGRGGEGGLCTGEGVGRGTGKAGCRATGSCLSAGFYGEAGAGH